VREVRVLVNGKPAPELVFNTDDDIEQPSDPFAAVDVVRFERDFNVKDILPPGRRDAYIVVEAGDPLPRTGDLDCDGLPDTSDNNGDGVIDFRDVDRNGDGVVDKSDSKDLTGPEKCADNYGATPSVDRPAFGPLKNDPPPARDDPSFVFYAVTPGALAYAFTNPLLFDRDADGQFEGPGL
jgi:hypothetical protein